MIKKSLVFVSIYFLIVIFSFAQDKRSLEKEKREKLKRIEETSKILDETRTQKKATIGQLNALNEEIKVRNVIIRNTQSEVTIINREINKRESDIENLGVTLKELKKEYALMIYTASKFADSYDKLVFLFSAKTFNQMVMRYKYITYYSQARKKQANRIKQISNNLISEKKRLLAQKIEKSVAVNTLKIENNNLNIAKSEQSEIASELGKRETELKKDLIEYKKSIDRLEKLITELIRREIEKNRKNNSADTPESTALTSNFSGNKLKLPWPVKSGFISQSYGRHPHPVLKNITIDNLGIDIQTNKDEPVRSVFDGKVTAVAYVPGMSNVVMIQHGDYYTFYAKLKSVSVETGQKIGARDPIGEVSTDKDDLSTVQFQIWKGSEKLDPEKWLIRR